MHTVGTPYRTGICPRNNWHPLPCTCKSLLQAQWQPGHACVPTAVLCIAALSALSTAVAALQAHCQHHAGGGPHNMPALIFKCGAAIMTLQHTAACCQLHHTPAAAQAPQKPINTDQPLHKLGSQCWLVRQANVHTDRCSPYNKPALLLTLL